MKKTYYRVRVVEADGTTRTFATEFNKHETALKAAQDFVETMKFTRVSVVEYEVEEKSEEVIRPKPLYKPLWEIEI